MHHAATSRSISGEAQCKSGCVVVEVLKQREGDMRSLTEQANRIYGRRRSTEGRNLLDIKHVEEINAAVTCKLQQCFFPSIATVALSTKETEREMKIRWKIMHHGGVGLLVP